MTDPIPDDLREKAEALCAFLEAMPSDGNVAAIAQALMQEREAQRERAVKMLVGIADLLAKRMMDSATPELLKALAEAIKSSDEPEAPSE